MANLRLRRATFVNFQLIKKDEKNSGGRLKIDNFLELAWAKFKLFCLGNGLFQTNWRLK